MSSGKAQRDEPPGLQRTSADIAPETMHVAKPQNGLDPTALADHIGAIQQDVQKALRKAEKRRPSRERPQIGFAI